MADETIAVLVEDWDAALRAEHDEIVQARGGRPLTSDELAAWLRAVDRRNRAHDGEAEEEGDDEALLERRVRIPGTDVVLRLPTLAARIRLASVDRWLADGRIDGRTHLVVQTYCLALGHDAAALGLVHDARSARATAEHWAACLTCSEEALLRSRARLFAGAYDDDAAEDEDPDDPKREPPAGPGSPPG